MWTPGYWAYADDGYFWVPGTWVLAPVGLLWTPGWWGWREGFYVWNPGYWGPHVGFYGGINYGYGYTGAGFIGGYWRGNAFFYNRAVASVNVTYVHNTYVQTAPAAAAATASRVSYNGGQGGLTVKPTTEERAYEQEQHTAPLAKQVQHENTAKGEPAQRYSVNKGTPQTAATTRPNRFTGNGAVRMNPNGSGYNYNHPGSPRMRPDRPARQPAQQAQPMMRRGNGDKHPPPRKRGSQ
jgi:hypothetical protein